MVGGIIIGLILAIVFLGGGIFLGMLLGINMEQNHNKRETPGRYKPIKPVSYSDYYRNYYYEHFPEQEEEAQEDNSEHEDDRDF